jgi:hypothetical protein
VVKVVPRSRCLPLTSPFWSIDCLAPLGRSGIVYRSESRRSTSVNNKPSLILRSDRPVYCTPVNDEQEGSRFLGGYDVARHHGV